MRKIYLIAIMLLIVLPVFISAATINAASCSYNDVSSVVNAAQSGDTVLVPAGSCTWDSQLVITKGIYIIGAGMNNTVITSNYSIDPHYYLWDDSFLITYNPSNPSADEPFRISGLTIDCAVKCYGIMLHNPTITPINKVRVDHTKILNPRDNRPTTVQGPVYGVADNNEWHGFYMQFFHPDSAWSYFTFDFGTADNFYVEDNLFVGSAQDMAIVSAAGTRWCSRHNIFDGSACTGGLFPHYDAHGNAAWSGVMGVEIYGNTVILPSDKGTIYFDQRGGKALVYNNNVTGSVAVGQEREEYLDSLSTPANGPSGQPQYVSDSYWWNNRLNNSTKMITRATQTLDYGGDIGVVPRENVHFWVEQDSFDGTVGVGVGLFSARPNTCAVGVGYWATDESKLYRCTATNTWTLYYTPYTYPHPLRTDCVNYPGLCDSSLPLPKVYWVSPTGASTWTNCQSSTSLSGASACSLTTANSNAVAGDTIYLRAGNYNTPISPAHNGISTSRITFKNYAGEKPVITGIDYGFSLGQKSYITVDGIDAVNVKTFLDARGANHLWVFNANLVNSSDTGGWPVGIRMYSNAQYNWLVNCTVGRVGYSTSTDDIGGVFNLGAWEDPNDTTSYNLIENNHFYYGGHHIVEINARYNIFRNNTFHNDDWMSCPRALTGNLCGNRDIIIEDDTPDTYWNVFEGNTFAFAGNSIDDTSGSTGASVRTPHNILRHNLFYHNSGAGVGLPTDSTGVYDARNNYVYNNVFYHNAYSVMNNDDYRYNFSLVFDNWAGGSALIPITGVAIKNNIFYKNSNGDIFFYYTNESSQTILGNYYSFMHASNSRGYYNPTIPAQNIKSSSDPGFVDITRTAGPWDQNPYDFHIMPTSPAIDAGVFLTTTTSSGSGTVIPVADAAYFIDGYGIVEGDMIQLQGQTARAQIVSIDYSTNRITVDTPLSWTSGLGVSLAYEGAAPDIGAYESSGGTSCVVADINCDGSVNVFDLFLMAADFGKTSGFNSRADTNGNGVIDIFDVVFVASRFT